MAKGDGKPEGNERRSCLQAFPSPLPLTLGRSTSWAPVGGKTACPTPARSVGTVCRPTPVFARWGEEPAGNCVLRCRQAPYPTGRALPPGGRKILAIANAVG